jgi:hypothetical protein
MPGIAHRNDQFCNGSTASYTLSANGFWSKHADDVSYNQLQKVLDSFFLFLRKFDLDHCFVMGFVWILMGRLSLDWILGFEVFRQRVFCGVWMFGCR